MAKELPYFKFYLNDWLTGNITLYDMTTQGVFINICVLFWSRDCELSYQSCIERFKKKDRKIVDFLVENKIIHVENQNISIKFLEKQLENSKILSKNNKKNGEIGLNTQKKMALANLDVGNIDKIRGDEIREDNIIKSDSEFFIRVGGKAILQKPSEYFKQNNALFFEQWQMKNGRTLVPIIFEQMDANYIGYDFTNDNHIQNTFNHVWGKIKTEKAKAPVEICKTRTQFR